MNTGEKHNRLTAIKKMPSGKWLFSCECGNEKEISHYPVARETTKSCGCLHKERCKIGANRVRHGFARKGNVHPLHGLWRGMLKRCYTKTTRCYPRYGGRGIVVCDLWKKDFVAFKVWAENNGYKKKLSLERKDNDGDYHPGNCVFADSKTQARNRRTSRKIVIYGEEKTVAEWAEILQIEYSVLYYQYVKKPHFERLDSR
jgi:hypothetical protein